MADQPGPEPSTPTKGDRAAEKARAKAERPWYKKKRFIILLVVVVLIIIGVATGGGDEAADIVTDDEPDTSGTEETEETEEVPEEAPDEVPEDAEFAGIGEPARDGQFEFVVTAFECGITTLGEDFLQEEASGQFCIITMTVENIGDSAQALSATDQLLYDADERQFSASFEAAFALESPLFEQINPGNTVEGQVPFDVPEDATIEFAELHDSPFSGGVLVDLR